MMKRKLNKTPVNRRPTVRQQLAVVQLAQSGSLAVRIVRDENKWSAHCPELSTVGVVCYGLGRTRDAAWKDWRDAVAEMEAHLKSKKKYKLVAMPGVLDAVPAADRAELHAALTKAFAGFDPTNPPGQPVLPLAPGQRTCPACGGDLVEFTTIAATEKMPATRMLDCSKCDAPYQEVVKGSRPTGKKDETVPLDELMGRAKSKVKRVKKSTRKK